MSEAVIDPVVFGEISDLMEESLPYFIETYLDNSPKLLARIAEGLSAGDLELVFHSAHQLKGGSGSIGAVRILQLANDIELMAKTGKDDGSLSSLVDELQMAYAAVEVELRQHL